MSKWSTSNYLPALGMRSSTSCSMYPYQQSKGQISGPVRTFVHARAVSHCDQGLVFHHIAHPHCHQTPTIQDLRSCRHGAYGHGSWPSCGSHATVATQCLLLGCLCELQRWALGWQAAAPAPAPASSTDLEPAVTLESIDSHRAAYPAAAISPAWPVLQVSGLATQLPTLLSELGLQQVGACCTAGCG